MLFNRMFSFSLAAVSLQWRRKTLRYRHCAAKVMVNLWGSNKEMQLLLGLKSGDFSALVEVSAPWSAISWMWP